MSTKATGNHDYLTLLGTYRLQRRRESVWTRLRTWWAENVWAVLALVVIAVVFWLAVGDTILRYLWSVS